MMLSEHKKQPSIIWDNAIKESDVDAVRALVHRTNVFSPEKVRVAGEMVENALATDADLAFVFARTQGGKKLVGYTCFGEIPLTDNRYDLYWIAIDPDFQGTSIGTELLTRTEQRIRNSGGRVVYVETSNHASYEPAHRLYLRNGFVKAAELADFYRRGEDKIIYSKRLVEVGSSRG